MIGSSDDANFIEDLESIEERGVKRISLDQVHNDKYTVKDKNLNLHEGMILEYYSPVSYKQLTLTTNKEV